MTDRDRIEAIAEALWDATPLMQGPWGIALKGQREQFLALARAAVEADPLALSEEERKACVHGLEVLSELADEVEWAQKHDPHTGNALVKLRGSLDA